jgi:acyl-CoA thioester hydrolase
VRRADRAVEAALRVSRIGTTSVTIEHELRLPDGTLAAEGSSVLVAWDAEARRPRPLTGEERAALS